MDPGELNTYSDKFAAVWRRVMSDNSEQNSHPANSEQKTFTAGTAETARLREFMDDEVCDEQLYGLIARKLSGQSRQTLLSIASDERHHLKKLKAKYFILTGKTYTPPASCPYTRFVPGTLRLKVMDESEGAKAYLTAASETVYTELAETYRALAADETRHSEMLSDIIEDMF